MNYKLIIIQFSDSCLCTLSLVQVQSMLYVIFWNVFYTQIFTLILLPPDKSANFHVGITNGMKLKSTEVVWNLMARIHTKFYKNLSICWFIIT
jgi:hypothetical protein